MKKEKLEQKIKLVNPNNLKYCNGCKWLLGGHSPFCQLLYDVKIWKELINGKLSGKFHRPKRCIKANGE